MLIDDVSVISNPGTGSAAQLIQNGTFQGDTLGSSPLKWRIIGNHSGTVVVDPTNSTNKVLDLVATGRTDHEGNNAGTTLADSAAIPNRHAVSNFVQGKVGLRFAANQQPALFQSRRATRSRSTCLTTTERPALRTRTLWRTPGRPTATSSMVRCCPSANQPVTISVRAARSGRNRVHDAVLFSRRRRIQQHRNDARKRTGCTPVRYRVSRPAIPCNSTFKAKTRSARHRRFPRPGRIRGRCTKSTTDIGPTTAIEVDSNRRHDHRKPRTCS